MPTQPVEHTVDLVVFQADGGNAKRGVHEGCFSLLALKKAICGRSRDRFFDFPSDSCQRGLTVKRLRAATPYSIRWRNWETSRNLSFRAQRRTVFAESRVVAGTISVVYSALDSSLRYTPFGMTGVCHVRRALFQVQPLLHSIRRTGATVALAISLRLGQLRFLRVRHFGVNRIAVDVAFVVLEDDLGFRDFLNKIRELPESCPRPAARRSRNGARPCHWCGPESP